MTAPHADSLFFRTLREEFPQLSGDGIFSPLVYLDSAATTLKPKTVISTLTSFYSSEYSTIHRSIYRSAQEASDKFYRVRTLLKNHFKGRAEEEFIFTKNTTDSLNLIADLLSKNVLTDQSTIFISAMEHHSNIIPWQLSQEKTKARLEIIPLTSTLSIDLEWLEQALKGSTNSVVSLCHISNVLGTINPLKEIAQLCHRYGALFVVDGAQSAPHLPIDLVDLGCDFFAFSSHKMYGPTGVGILWGKKELLERFEPTHGGGGMIEKVSFEKTSYGQLPIRFEAGTPAIAEVIAFGAALSFLQSIGQERIDRWEGYLTRLLRTGLQAIPEVVLIGGDGPRGALQSLSFTTGHPLDVATLLDTKGIAVRTGHLCAQPLLDYLKKPSLLRVSFGLYNTIEECHFFLQSLQEALLLLK